MSLPLNYKSFVSPIEETKASKLAEFFGKNLGKISVEISNTNCLETKQKLRRKYVNNNQDLKNIFKLKQK